MNQDDTARLYGRRSVSKANKRLRNLLILSLCALFCSFCIPLSFTDSKLTVFAAWVALVISVAFLIISTKKVLVTVLSALLIFFVVNLTGSPLMPALVLCTVIPGALTAAVASDRSVRHLPLVLALLLFPLSYGISFLLTGELLIAASAPLVLLPGLILALFKRFKGEPKTALVCAAIPLIVATITVAVLTIYIHYGRLDLETFSLATEQITEELVKALRPKYAELGIPDNHALSVMLHTMIATCVNLLPGLITALSLVAAYLTGSLQTGVSHALLFTEEEKEADEPAKLSVSSYAALLFLIGYILSFATSPAGTESFVGVAATNLCVILGPAMLYAGIDGLRTLSQKGPGGFLGVVGILFAAFLSASMYAISFLVIFALIGSASILLIAVDGWAKEHYGKGENL